MIQARLLMVAALTAVLAGCSSLPADGPTGRAVTRGAAETDPFGGYAIVDLDYATSERIKTVAPAFAGSLTGAGEVAPSDVIGQGDTLNVAIFEPSGALFGGGFNSGSTVTGSGLQAGARNLPGLVVDRSGQVGIPFGGQVRVEGLTTTEAAGAIRRALAGRVGNPQVLVSIGDNASNAVTVIGDVRQPGRAPLSINADRVLDVIAARGGSARAPQDLNVVVQRGGQTYSAPLSAVTTAFDENIRLQRGDQINLVYQPRRYSTFGALGAVARTDMPPGEVTLAAAISTVGGLNPQLANARSVLVFRFERPEVAQALGLTQAPTSRGVPVVYRLNLAEGSGFFIAGNFLIQPEDIVFVPRAGYAELQQFFTFVQSITRVYYDVAVTTALNRD